MNINPWHVASSAYVAMIFASMFDFIPGGVVVTVGLLLLLLILCDIKEVLETNKRRR